MIEPVRIGVIGGGISGLATAYYLQEKNRHFNKSIEIEIIERADRLGGVIRSEKVGDFLLEWGPEGFVSRKRPAIQLIKQLGLEAELQGSNDHQRRNYLVHHGELLPYPDGMAFLSPINLSAFWRTAPLTTRGKFRALLEPFIGRSRGDMSVAAFFDRRSGREFTRRVVEPMVGAIYGADVTELSVNSALPEIYRIEQRYRSLWWGLRNHSRNGGDSGSPSFLTFGAGMGRLVDGLEKALERVNIRTGMKETELTRENGRFYLRADDLTSHYDYLVMTAPAPAASRLLQTIDEELSRELKSIPYSSSSLIYLAYQKSDFSHPLDGFGFIVSEEEAAVLDACTWVHKKFDGRCPDDSVLLRCAVHNGRRNRQFSSDQELVLKVHQEISRLLRVSCQPVFTRVFHVDRALPQLLVGHQERLERIQQQVDACRGLFLSGAFYGGVGIPECISAGEATASKILSVIQ